MRDTPCASQNVNSRMDDRGMRILDALGITRRSDEAPALSPAVMPLPRSAYVDTREITGLDAVFRCLAYLQTLAGQLTIDAWRKGSPLPAPSLVAHPDISLTQRAWIIANVAALSQTGNAFWHITRDPQGQVANVKVVSPSRITVSQDQQYRLHYSLDGDQVPDGVIAHLRYLTIENEALGLGPLQAARRGLEGMVKLNRYADNLFTEGGVPSGILSTDQPLTQDQADAAARTWETKQHLGKTAVLGQGLTYKPTAITPTDLQWLDSQKWSVTRVARLFGVPPSKLAIGVDGASMTYQNVEQAALDAMRDTLMGYLSPIEDQLTALLPRGQHARFNLDAVLRPDTKTRYEAHEIGIRAGFLTPDEVRQIEGLTPLTDQALERQ